MFSTITFLLFSAGNYVLRRRQKKYDRREPRIGRGNSLGARLAANWSELGLGRHLSPLALAGSVGPESGVFQAERTLPLALPIGMVLTPSNSFSSVGTAHSVDLDVFAEVSSVYMSRRDR